MFYKSRKTFYQKEEAMKNETTADQYVFVEQHSTSYNASSTGDWIMSDGFGGLSDQARNREPGLNLGGPRRGV